MLTFVEKYSKNYFSQNGEYGIIAECLRRIGTHYDLACEFGAADGFYYSNTAALGLRRLLYDINPSGKVQHGNITPENVNDLVPAELDVLSIDIDGNDYNVWAAYKGVANIVVIEINSSINPFSPIPISDPKDGTGYWPMVQLGLFKGYFLLCHTGNCIFILNEFRHLFPEVDGLGAMKDAELFFRRDWIKHEVHGNV